MRRRNIARHSGVVMSRIYELGFFFFFSLYREFYPSGKSLIATEEFIQWLKLNAISSAGFLASCDGEN